MESPLLIMALAAGCIFPAIYLISIIIKFVTTEKEIKKSEIKDILMAIVTFAVSFALIIILAVDNSAKEEATSNSTAVYSNFTFYLDNEIDKYYILQEDENDEYYRVYIEDSNLTEILNSEEK
jgi:hypothetical protein